MSLTVRLLRPTEDELFREVKRLGRGASRTVGFLPAGAYEDYLWRRGILVAMDDRDVVGYLLHATTRERVRIAQLVVVRERRGEGIARVLFEALCRDRATCYALMLKCRVDFDASALWKQLGFEPIETMQGRAGVLVRWWLRLETPGVFAGDVPRIGMNDQS